MFGRDLWYNYKTNGVITQFTLAFRPITKRVIIRINLALTSITKKDFKHPHRVEKYVYMEKVFKITFNPSV